MEHAVRNEIKTLGQILEIYTRLHGQSKTRNIFLCLLHNSMLVGFQIEYPGHGISIPGSRFSLVSDHNSLTPQLVIREKLKWIV